MCATMAASTMAGKVVSHKAPDLRVDPARRDAGPRTFWNSASTASRASWGIIRSCSGVMSISSLSMRPAFLSGHSPSAFNSLTASRLDGTTHNETSRSSHARWSKPPSLLWTLSVGLEPDRGAGQDALVPRVLHAVGERIVLQPDPFRVDVVGGVAPDLGHAPDRELLVVVPPDQRQVAACGRREVAASRDHVVLVAVEGAGADDHAGPVGAGLLANGDRDARERAVHSVRPFTTMWFRNSGRSASVGVFGFGFFFFVGFFGMRLTPCPSSPSRPGVHIVRIGDAALEGGQVPRPVHRHGRPALGAATHERGRSSAVALVVLREERPHRRLHQRADLLDHAPCGGSCVSIRRSPQSPGKVIALAVETSFIRKIPWSVFHSRSSSQRRWTSSGESGS